ncbi:MAG: sulfatase [Planctomycetes bacterium]|nr:sulfatase [Planctomycetota bacterium]
MLLIFWGLIGISASASVNVFTDSFNRPDNDNISASPVGMSGLAAPMIYIERGDALTGNDALTRIFGNALRLADGPNASTLFLDHNFTNPEILAAGGMRVGLTIVSDNGTVADRTRWCGFGVGNSLTECQQIQFDHNGVGFRGQDYNGVQPGTSDLFISWSPRAGGSGVVNVYKNGPTAAGGEGLDIPVDGLQGNDRLEMELAISDFDAGSTIIAKILWNGEVIHTTSFQWDHTHQNYLGLCARQNNQGFTVDDLTIEAVSVISPSIFSLGATPSFVPSNQSEVPIILRWDAIGMQAGFTYAVTADKAIVFPNADESGPAENGQTAVEGIIDGTGGDVTLTVTLYDAQGDAVVWRSVTVRQIPAQNPQTPNFIVILTDDQGWGTTSIQLDPDVPASKSDFFETPRLERLAQNGLRFTQAYSAHPNCSPSRAALLTGRSPAALHFTDIVGRNSGVHYDGLPMIPATHINDLPEAEMTIPELLKRHNSAYTAAHFGKWHLRGGGPNNHGFDAGDGATGNAQGDGNPPDDPKQVFGIARRGNEWMQNQVIEGKPFYLQLSHYATHLAIEYRPETKNYFETKPAGNRHHHPGFAAMLYDLDEAIGLTIDKVFELGIQDNTYIIYTADNGTYPLEMPENINGPLRGWKATLWEGGVRVPFVVIGPGIAKGTISKEPVVGYDILPTICDLAGMDLSDLPPQVEGGSFAHILRGHLAPILRPREGLVFHWPHYQVDKFSTPDSTVLLDGYKLHYRWETAKKQLFHLDEDLAEKTDLARYEQALANQMAQGLFEHLEAIGARLATPNPAYPAECWNPNKGDYPPNDFMGRDPSIYDLNRDCVVDISDLAIWVSQWLMEESIHVPNGSGTMTLNDFAEMARDWKGCWWLPSALHCD